MKKIDLVKLVEEVDKEEMIEGGVHKIFALTCLYKFIEMQEEAINYTHSSLKLEEKHKTDFDVWAISKGYTKMEGEYVKEPEVYNYEFLLQLYNEQN